MVVRNDQGQAMIELAITLPLMILLFMGAIDVGLTILNKTMMQQAANSAAMAAADILPDITAAEIRAIEFAKANGAREAEIQTSITAEAATVTITRPGMIIAGSFRDKPFTITTTATYPAY